MAIAEEKTRTARASDCPFGVFKLLVLKRSFITELFGNVLWVIRDI
jgi:hypothetical protein